MGCNAVQVPEQEPSMFAGGNESGPFFEAEGLQQQQQQQQQQQHEQHQTAAAVGQEVAAASAIASPDEPAMDAASAVAAEAAAAFAPAYAPPALLPWSTGVPCYFEGRRLKANVDDGMGGYMDSGGSKILVSASGTAYVLLKQLALTTGSIKGETKLAYVIRQNADGRSWAVDTQDGPYKRAIKMLEMPSVKKNATDAQREVKRFHKCTFVLQSLSLLMNPSAVCPTNLLTRCMPLTRCIRRWN
jgi:hypothetical protein